MKRKEIINNLWQGENGNDIAETMQVSSSWVKENDQVIYDSLLDMLEEFAAEDTNTCSKEDVEDFKAGDWLVEYYFREGGVGYNAGRDSQGITNQPEWFADEWEDIPTRQLIKYANHLEKQRD